MENFEKNYKSTFDKVSISNKELDDLQNNLYKKHNKSKLRCLALSVIILCLTFTTVVYGKEIVNTIKGFIIEEGTVELSNSGGTTVEASYTKFTETVEIKEDNPFNENVDKNSKYSDIEIEKNLGIKILKNPYVKNYIIDKISYNDSKCSTLSFNTSQDDYYMKDDYWYIQIGFLFHTQYASEKELNQAYSIETQNSESSAYYIKSLKTDVNIQTYKTNSGANSPTIAEASFIYNNIAYHIKIMKKDYNPKDLYDVLESFTF